MREIKYKAWDTHKNKMWSAEEMGQDELTINPDGRGFVNVNGQSPKLSHYLPHLIPLQYINLKDKNDKEIYEGDIGLLHEYRDNFEASSCALPSCDIFKIIFHEGNLVFKFIDEILLIQEYWAYGKDLEIIGNIYENPELME